jgi:ATP-dependent exoDNAse (exonuclease V) beta subunit
VKAALPEAALAFPRKISPSGLIRKRTPPVQADIDALDHAPVRSSIFENEATRYGGWWHALLEMIEWNAVPGDWDAKFEAALAAVSQQERARAEWKLLHAHVSGAGDFRKHLGAQRFVAHAEVPFSLKLDPTTALEGVIDLVLIDPKNQRALVLDWKTNQVTPDESGSLLAKYRPQLAAYREAVRRITGLAVDAALYSTATGKLLTYDEATLTTEWLRLAELPGNQLRTEVAPDDI